MTRKHLQNTTKNFLSATSLTPVTGAEIEFYLIGELPADIIDIIAAKCAYLEILDVKKEEGNGQYEVSFLHVKDPCSLADRILSVRQAVTDLALELGVKADFSAKPFVGDYGNSLHIHLSLLDNEGNNALQKNGEDESDMMLYAIGGLLANMPENMDVFAPYPACYERLKGGMDAPGTISWGGNNRTVALRLPSTSTDPQNRRVEHRVAAADADPYLVIAAILGGVLYGVVNKVLPESEKIYGDANLPVFGQKRIVTIAQ
ncbi:MAG: glutamine synthetase [Rickettsiaceae bacterium]|jgi:glutamine synthetase|nr:glutamine synthetase [Rickettsiaceae bacterium]